MHIPKPNKQFVQKDFKSLDNRTNHKATDKLDEPELNGDHAKQSNKAPTKTQPPINQMQFNQQTNNLKINHQIPNQLDQETSATDETNSDANKRKKLLPEWIRAGLDRMEREKQKKIEKEENLIKKAKEEQIRKELDDEDEKDEVLKTSDAIVEEKKKLFSSGGGFHQKTFADMFLVKKSKEYYYESEEAREKELVNYYTATAV